MPFRGISIEKKGGLAVHLAELHINVQLALNLLETLPDDDKGDNNKEIARILTKERRTRLTAINAPKNQMGRIAAVTVKGWRLYL